MKTIRQYTRCSWLQILLTVGALLFASTQAVAIADNSIDKADARIYGDETESIEKTELIVAIDEKEKTDELEKSDEMPLELIDTCDKVAYSDAVEADVAIKEISDTIEAIEAKESISAIVYNFDELTAWINEHPLGGTVVLGEDLEVIEETLFFYGDEPITIETGPYSFVIKGSLEILGNVRIQGKGAPSPVLRVCTGGSLFINSNEIYTATDESGIALALELGSNYTADIDCRPIYRTEGMNGIAVKAEIPLRLEYHTIEAIGNGARGLVSTQSVSLYLCVVTSSGTAVESTEIILDTCVVSPQIFEAVEIKREITKINFSMFSRIYFVAGEGTVGDLGAAPARCIVTLSAEGHSDTRETLFIQFDDSTIDYSTPGTYLMPGILLPPFDIFPLIATGDPLELPVDIYDQDVPYFEAMYMFGSTPAIRCFYMGDMEALTLWRSDDGGQSWYDYWPSGAETNFDYVIEAGFEEFYIIFENMNTTTMPFWLVFEVDGGKGSDVLIADMRFASGGLGGDRDGGDRLPWSFFASHFSGDDTADGDTPPPGFEEQSPAELPEERQNENDGDDSAIDKNRGDSNEEANRGPSGGSSSSDSQWTQLYSQRQWEQLQDSQDPLSDDSSGAQDIEKASSSKSGNEPENLHLGAQEGISDNTVATGQHNPLTSDEFIHRTSDMIPDLYIYLTHISTWLKSFFVEIENALQGNAFLEVELSDSGVPLTDHGVDMSHDALLEVLPATSMSGQKVNLLETEDGIAASDYLPDRRLATIVVGQPLLLHSTVAIGDNTESSRAFFDFGNGMELMTVGCFFGMSYYLLRKRGKRRL